MKSSAFSLFALLIILSVTAPQTSADTFKKRYVFDMSGVGSRHAMQVRAEGLAKKRLLSDYIGSKLSPELALTLAEDIDVNLTPADKYLHDFKVLSTDDEDRTKVMVTVQGEVDLPAILEALTSAHVLRFGEPPPKVLFMPSTRSAEYGITKAVEALVYDRLKGSGVRPVSFEAISKVTSVQGKISESQIRIIAQSATEYQADYIVFIDAAPDVRPASVGGYICDLDLTYTIVRPNNNIILGEGVASDRGSGNSAQIAIDRALDSTAPMIATRAVGQLYESIFADSDVISDSPHLKSSITLSILFKDSSTQTQQIVDALRLRGANVTPATGGVADRFVVESTMSSIDLYSALNGLVLPGPAPFTTPVVQFAENTIAVEIVKQGAATRGSVVPAPKIARNATRVAVVKLRRL